MLATIKVANNVLNNKEDKIVHKWQFYPLCSLLQWLHVYVDKHVAAKVFA